MENNSKLRNIASTSGRKKQLDIVTSDIDTDSDCEEIICPAGKLRRILLYDSEEESNSEDCEPNFTSEEWIWEDKENNSKIWQYSRIPGMNIEMTEETTALQMLNQILSKDFWNIIVTESNRYASQTIGDTARKIKKSEEKWRDTNIDEIQAYFALCILMAQVRKLNVQSYWSRKSIIETPIFGKTMPLLRFMQLSHFLHFSNNEVVDKNDRLCKIRNIIDYLNEKFTSIYTPEEYVSLDEFIMKYNNRMSYNEYKSSKRVRFRIKFYKLCESKSGYCIKFQTYTGQDNMNNSITNSSENVTMFMCTPISNFGHTLFLDDWFSSPNLFQKLQSIKTNAIGTVKYNRKNMPKDLATIQLKQSEAISRSCKDVAQQILESVCIPEYINRGRPSAGDVPKRLQSKCWGHFPRIIPPTEAKQKPQRRCRVCTKHKKRSETVWECKKCLVALHVPNCFEIYHTQVNY
ncbi:PREDICTED: piggyBac transposable element-derived protein 4-like [Polistes dominula]|uniref:PiggyBac transposable element-derived protein 4-like n=1 Tax=Polistes dominula TaxID=743375 RepID=A0ABM1J023_POLDO|nr:PREDICTED: piggyBac transposable element-derived protein 4-like [Polistes dominula]